MFSVLTSIIGATGKDKEPQQLNDTRGREFFLMQAKLQEGRETDSKNRGDLLPSSPEPSLACSNGAAGGDRQP